VTRASASRFALAAAAAVLLGRAAPASSAELQVNPVRIELSAEARSEVVTLKNASTEPTSFELQLRAWGESKAGEMILAPTEDVVVFPLVVLLAPGEERNVRVGAAIPFGPVEKTYRLFVQELPPPAKEGATSQVRVLTRVGIPVFLTPRRVAERAELKALSVRDGKASFSLLNGGTVHVRPTAVRVALKDARGNSIGNREAAAWYVLAGGERDYQVDLRGDRCAAVREVTASVALDSKQVLEADLATPDGVCAP
jgi:fimbrial chaperone protein